MSVPISKLTDNFSETEIDGEIVVMNLETGDFYSLTGTGRDIWRLVDGAHDRDAVLAALATSYRVEQADIATEVDGFLAQLRGAGLLDGA